MLVYELNLLKVKLTVTPFINHKRLVQILHKNQIVIVLTVNTRSSRGSWTQKIVVTLVVELVMVNLVMSWDMTRVMDLVQIVVETKGGRGLDSMQMVVEAVVEVEVVVEEEVVMENQVLALEMVRAMDRMKTVVIVKIVVVVLMPEEYGAMVVVAI
ncbi:hypothetical protein H5410_061036, partial [Solanum commersonii]